MEENRYPTFESAVKVQDELDNLDWSSYPLIGPRTTAEAVARAQQAWEDRNDPSKWVTSEQMWNRLYEKMPK